MGNINEDLLGNFIELVEDRYRIAGKSPGTLKPSEAKIKACKRFVTAYFEHFKSYRNGETIPPEPEGDLMARYVYWILRVTRIDQDMLERWLDDPGFLDRARKIPEIKEEIDRLPKTFWRR